MPNLREQNRWLRDPDMRTRAMRVAAASSSAVEGIRKPYQRAKPLKGRQKHRK